MLHARHHDDAHRRFDVEHETPVRGPDGLCIECKPDEVGEAIGQISSEPGRRFDGYTQKADTEKKILRDVFEEGDSWFRTGDLMRRDELGYFYFVDRIGDTFRWKGENVATSEVAEALASSRASRRPTSMASRCPAWTAAPAWPHSSPDRASMCRSLADALAGNLPAYARPVFVRLQPEIEITGTFKQRKVELVKEGFDLAAFRDPIFWLDPATRAYEPLTRENYAAIVSGQVKL